jgi:hypothetical protein
MEVEGYDRKCTFCENPTMLRTLIAVLLSLAVVGTFGAPPAQAISRNNPYRSFNVSGVNYGSMQWELKHGRKSAGSASTGSSSRWLFRRR